MKEWETLKVRKLKGKSNNKNKKVRKVRKVRKHNSLLTFHLFHFLHFSHFSHFLTFSLFGFLTFLTVLHLPNKPPAVIGSEGGGLPFPAPETVCRIFSAEPLILDCTAAGEGLRPLATPLCTNKWGAKCCCSTTFLDVSRRAHLQKTKDRKSVV